MVCLRNQFLLLETRHHCAFLFHSCIVHFILTDITLNSGWHVQVMICNTVHHKITVHSIFVIKLLIWDIPFVVSNHKCMFIQLLITHNELLANAFCISWRRSPS